MIRKCRFFIELIFMFILSIKGVEANILLNLSITEKNIYNNCTSSSGYYYYYNNSVDGTKGNCIICPAGYYCEKRSFGIIDLSSSSSIDDPSPIPCPAGMISSKSGSNSISQCSKCLEGTFSPRIGATTCENCPVGTYYYGVGAYLASSCIVCPAGYSCRFQKDLPSQCSMGTFSNFSATVCTNCPAGTFSNIIGKPTNCNPCLPGTFSPASGFTTCQTCSEGYSSARGSKDCSICPAGTFASFSGSRNCTRCSVGSFSVNPGSPSCTVCPKGYEIKANSNLLGSNSLINSCTACPVGKYKDVEGISEFCKPCPIGFYSSTTQSVACTYCGAGKTTAANGSSSVSSCIATTAKCPPIECPPPQKVTNGCVESTSLKLPRCAVPAAFNMGISCSANHHVSSVDADKVNNISKISFANSEAHIAVNIEGDLISVVTNTIETSDPIYNGWPYTGQTIKIYSILGTVSGVGDIKKIFDKPFQNSGKTYSTPRFSIPVMGQPTGSRWLFFYNTEDLNRIYRISEATGWNGNPESVFSDIFSWDNFPGNLPGQRLFVRDFTIMPNKDVAAVPYDDVFSFYENTLNGDTMFGPFTFPIASFKTAFIPDVSKSVRYYIPTPKTDGYTEFRYPESIRLYRSYGVIYDHARSDFPPPPNNEKIVIPCKINELNYGYNY